MTQTLFLRQHNREQARRLVSIAPDGHVLQVSPPVRSNEQNKKMWAALSEISRAKPEGRNYPPEVWKALVMDMAGLKPRFEPALDGNGVVCTGYRSSRLRKDEMSDVIEAIYAYAAQHGIELSE